MEIKKFGLGEWLVIVIAICTAVLSFVYPDRIGEFVGGAAGLAFLIWLTIGFNTSD